MAEEMTPEARRAFLTTGTRTAILATTQSDGRPHAVPVCFVLDDDDVLFLTNGTTAKGRALQRDPRVTLVVDDERPPFAFVMIEGSAEASRDADDIERVAPRIAERYFGPDSVEDFVGFAHEALGTLVRVKPTKIVALDRVGEQ
ncbi:MAG: PPOX class F420-dependent oxidoreductase [Acidimicrobiales bacterium]